MVTTILILALGLGGAWLVNYLSDVLPRYRRFVAPPCPDCQARLGSCFYLAMRPCGECGNKPSLRHWAVVITLPLLAVLLRYYPPPVFGEIGGILWLVYFSLVVVIDLEHRLILHPVSLVGAILGLIYGILSHGVAETLSGGAAGFGIMLLFYFLGELFIRYLSKRRDEDIQEVALGFGDVNLAGVLGLVLGWPGVVGGIFMAILIGGVVSGIFFMVQSMRKKYHSFQALPYGPFLVASVWILLYISEFVS